MRLTRLAGPLAELRVRNSRGRRGYAVFWPKSKACFRASAQKAQAAYLSSTHTTKIYCSCEYPPPPPRHTSSRSTITIGPVGYTYSSLTLASHIVQACRHQHTHKTRRQRFVSWHLFQHAMAACKAKSSGSPESCRGNRLRPRSSPKEQR